MPTVSLSFPLNEMGAIWASATQAVLIATL